MTNPSAGPALAMFECRAEVRTGGEAMQYLRAGTGRPVLLLAPELGETLWPEVLQALVTRSRVMVPELAADDATASRLVGFLEGLGATDVLLVATSDYCLAALELTLAAPDQISRLLLVPDGEPLDGESAAELGGTLREVPVLLRVLRRGTATDEALAAVTAFLG
jgi:hypothetical protein